MTALRIQLSATERSCTVDGGELQLWGRGVIDEILFEAAKAISSSDAQKTASACLTFQVKVDRDDGSIVIEI